LWEQSANAFSLLAFGQAPWPHISALADATHAAGKILVPRLPVYPNYIADAATWLDPEVARVVLASSDAMGYARAEDWSPGMAVKPPPLPDVLRVDTGRMKERSSGAKEEGGVNGGFEATGEEAMAGSTGSVSSLKEERGAEQTMQSEASTSYDSAIPSTGSGSHRTNGSSSRKQARFSSKKDASKQGKVQVGADGTLFGQAWTSADVQASARVRELTGRAMDGQDLTASEIKGLFQARGDDFVAICQAADELRRQVNGDTVRTLFPSTQESPQHRTIRTIESSL
jgi:hypothetical protein